MTSTTSRRTTGSPARRSWRTVDIVVAAVIAVAFGAVFQAWNLLWNAVQPAFAAFPPGQGFMYGLWLLPAVLGGFIIRRPGAALFCETVAALVSVLVGAPWATTVILYGIVQGLGAEVVFAATGYRRWSLPVALTAGALAGVGSAVLDIVLYYNGWALGWIALYVALLVVSGAVIAGAGAWALTKALAPTGVLAPFASGREQRAT